SLRCKRCTAGRAYSTATGRERMPSTITVPWWRQQRRRMRGHDHDGATWRPLPPGRGTVSDRDLSTINLIGALDARTPWNGARRWVGVRPRGRSHRPHPTALQSVHIHPGVRGDGGTRDRGYWLFPERPDV